MRSRNEVSRAQGSHRSEGLGVRVVEQAIDGAKVVVWVKRRGAGALRVVTVSA